MQFSKDIVKKVRCGQPIEAYGLTLYPIMMSDYDEYMLCKDAFAIMQGSLPAKYLSTDFLSALFAMSLDEKREDVQAELRTAAFQRVIRLFYMALRSTDEEIEHIARDIVYKQTNNDIVAIDHIVIYQNGKATEITPSLFSTKIRPLIAFQNGIVLPDEDTNPDLIKLHNKMHEHDQPVKLVVDFDEMMASVAYLSSVTVAQITEWTVRDFEYRVHAIDRDKRYMLCGAAEMSGFASFKNGNPAPSWQYDLDVDALETKSLSDLGKTLQGAGVRQKS